MPRSFALGDHFETMIDTLVQGGRYNNASEVVRAALRLLEDRETERRQKVEEIRRSIEESRRSGQVHSEDEVFSRLEARYAAMAERAGE
ncbi:type II toxin-antitoxin system ParD family antitoxin [Paracraurococcus lichenis]|uniref:Type II toxin-antitoxin system ParD family antitoxin n=1 Tax=Paracraurococcus lichenis TaxID=3064888 RepID=A0ABT9DT13_9PROT|nr:type II toxin-antitoxin system ParD family antitoxin [Paracraurococcus sp. LOR1-02]MDO9707023.1 type II toxin-antitoxin system ParD family antitoxin [Paracraurococcus sp. LOR1-02]